MPEKSLKITPSKLDRAVLCPGSVYATKDVPWKDSPAANRGRALHDAMALLFQVGESAWAKIAQTIPANPVCKAGDVEILKAAYGWGRELFPDDPNTIVLIEQPLDVTFMGMEGGKPDAVFASPKYKGAVLIDWKFGSGVVDDPEANWQMRAYSAALIANLADTKYLKQYSFGFDPLRLESIEAAIIQPSAMRKDDSVRSHVFHKDELRTMAKTIQGAVAMAKAPGAPLVASKAACQWCDAKPNCQAYKDFAAGIAVAKAEIKQAEIAAVTTDGTAIMVSPKTEISFPLVVINAETILLAEQKKRLIMELKVVDATTADTMGRLCKDARGLVTLIDKNRRAILKPIEDEVIKMVNSEAKKATDPLNDAGDYGDKQVLAWRVEETRKANAIREEQERKQREAEANARKAQQEEDERKKAAARAMVAAQEAEQRAANLKTKEARDKALALAAEETRKAQAEIDKAKAAEQARLQAEAQANAAHAAQAAASAPAKTTGYRDVENVSWEIPDFAKIPAGFLEVVLMLNEKNLKTMVGNGTLNEAKHGDWLKITRTQGTARSR